MWGNSVAVEAVKMNRNLNVFPSIDYLTACDIASDK